MSRIVIVILSEEMLDPHSLFKIVYSYQSVPQNYSLTSDLMICSDIVLNPTAFSDVP
jgi:hypothetical protein